MSKVSISGDTNGTGNFTLKAPATNTDRVFDLPDEAGTVLTNVSDIETQVKTATNATGTAPVYACRAWVNFNGTGTVSIRDSGNVSSITDSGTGEYRVNFGAAFPDANFSAVAAIGDGSGSEFSESVQIDSVFTGSLRLNIAWDSSSGATYQRQDASKINVVVFR